MLGLKDAVWPEACAGCRRMARGGLCRRCFEALPRIDGPVCDCCGRPSVSPVPGCADCRNRGLRFDVARQAAGFGPVLRRAVHRFKYSGCCSLGLPLAELVAEAAFRHRLDAQAVTWVPASPERLRRTGLDHGRLIAEIAARDLGLPVLPLGTRTRHTRPQMSLSPDQRRTNLAGAFRATICPPESVLLVDDVFTTGSTVSEVARVLKSAGAVRVSVAAAARSFTPLQADL